jgi:hypothetical protein
MKNETVEEFLARGGSIDRTEVMHGSASLNMFSRHSANYRAGSGKMRKGKGVGTHARTEGWATDPS